MQIVIEISEDDYAWIKQLPYEAIINSIQLPEGHGDLIDRTELLKQPLDCANYPSNYVHMAKAIIKADNKKGGIG